MSTYYVIKTPTGYAGRVALEAPVSVDLPAGLAYTFPTHRQATAFLNYNALSNKGGHVVEVAG